MNNEIGISTLGFTNDNYLIIWTQNRSSQSSEGLLVPTGSGSCDWNDRVNDDFKRTILNAMQRELWEENGGKTLAENYHIIGETILLGFFRWIIKGGKPEFVGITKLNKDLIDIGVEKKEVFGRREYPISSLDDLKDVINELLGQPNLSVPLYVNLKFLGSYCDSNRLELEQFLFNNTAS